MAESEKPAEKLNKAKKHKKKARPGYKIDEQTGVSFKVTPEDWFATSVAGASALYLAAATAFLLWLLFDTWSGRNQLLVAFGYNGKALAASGTFRLLAYVALGGALGAAVDGIRSLVAWHSELSAYGPRFFWRDFTLPLVGATVGLIVYLTVRGGAGVLSGDFSLGQKGTPQVFAAFATAALAGFSARQVFRWLDSQANRIFSVAKPSQTAVPDLRGKTLDEVKAMLKQWKLTLGAVSQAVEADHVGKVVDQSPAPGAVVTGAAQIDVTIAAAPAAGPAPPS
jgi:hypothetical protein